MPHATYAIWHFDSVTIGLYDRAPLAMSSNDTTTFFKAQNRIPPDPLHESEGRAKDRACCTLPPYFCNTGAAAPVRKGYMRTASAVGRKRKLGFSISCTAPSQNVHSLHLGDHPCLPFSHPQPAAIATLPPPRHPKSGQPASTCHLPRSTCDPTSSPRVMLPGTGGWGDGGMGGLEDGGMGLTLVPPSGRV